MTTGSQGIELEGDLDASGLRFGVVASRWNAAVVDDMLAATIAFLARRGATAEDLQVVRVPGAWEIPAALAWLSEAEPRPDGLIALGAVIRGGTPHFDYVCEACTRGCEQVQAQSGLPVGFGILTCDDLGQARARAGGREGNKGEEAAEASLRMVRLKRLLDASNQKAASRNPSAAPSES